MGRTYDQVYDGEWMHLSQDGMMLACCDCGLVHDVAVKVKRAGKGRKIYLRVSRHARATAAMRRPFKFTKEE